MMEPVMCDMWQYLKDYISCNLQTYLAVTFSHVSRKPMSHLTPSKVENSSKATNITKCLEYFHV